MAAAEPPHVSVLLTEILSVLAPQPGEAVLDCTLGAGGHAAALLTRTAPDGRLTGLDADTENLAIAKQRLAPYGDRVTCIHANFREIAALGLAPTDIILADLGLSSMHVDEPDRGFSFRTDAPLDLRFDRTSGRPAAETLAHMREEDIRFMLGKLGELREAPKLAAAIYRSIHRDQGSLRTTGDLRALCERVLGYRASALLPQVFQALRMQVNDELGALKALLDTAPRLLAPGGRLGIIAFHSLEDRMVKETFRAWSTPERDPLTGQDRRTAPFTPLTRKPLQPGAEETHENPRARSAKFRAVRRTATL